MTRTTSSALAGVVGLAILATAVGEAHKPVTSKYTFNEHVFPILRDRCGACHVDGGAAPMSLMTFGDARPWAESIRAELVAGRMPPAQAETSVGAFKNARLLAPRDLDIVVTWATGGTPEGPPLPAAASAAPSTDWPLGPPDVTIPIPSAVTLPPRVMEATQAFRLPSTALEGRAIRAVDIRPGTRSMVRRALVFAEQAESPPHAAMSPERVLAIWSPARDTIDPDDGVFLFPQRAALVAQITYRKTWRFENVSLSDRSVVGVYFADRARRLPIDSISISEPFVLTDAVRALAVRTDAAAGDGEITVTALLPGGARESLIRFLGMKEWPRRFWFEQPIRLPPGTRLESSAPGITVDVVRADR
jgi:hypothetical protein